MSYLHRPNLTTPSVSAEPTQTFVFSDTRNRHRRGRRSFTLRRRLLGRHCHLCPLKMPDRVTKRRVLVSQAVYSPGTVFKDFPICLPNVRIYRAGSARDDMGCDPGGWSRSYLATTAARVGLPSTMPRCFRDNRWG
jgi:hypothetical protein